MRIVIKSFSFSNNPGYRIPNRCTHRTPRDTISFRCSLRWRVKR